MDGQVMSSSPGRLRCKTIIHAVGPRWSDGKSEERDLANCIQECFRELLSNGYKSIAIPPISTGVFGFPLELAVKTIVSKIIEQDKTGQMPSEIILIDNKEDSLRYFECELRARTKTVLPRNRPTPTSRTIQQSNQGVFWKSAVYVF